MGNDVDKCKNCNSINTIAYKIIPAYEATVKTTDAFIKRCQCVLCSYSFYKAIDKHEMAEFR